MADSIEVIMDKASELKSKYAERDELYDELEQMTFMDWSGKSEAQKKAANVKVTVSPDARNQLLAAVQLMSTSDPHFRVPGAKNFMGNESKIEKFVQALWVETNKLAGTSLLYDLIFSSLLYGEAHIATTEMKEYVSHYEKMGLAYEKRAKRAAKRSPVMFRAMNPHECYTEYDNLGLVEHYRKSKVSAKKVAGDWGDEGVKAVGNLSDSDDVVYNEWWDLEKHCVWLNEGETILDVEHKLPFIPIESAITDGSQKLFGEVKYQRQPFLYAVAKSGLWDRQNLTLSALYTLIFGIGFSPLFAYQRSQPGKELEVDLSRPFNTINLDPGESLTALARNVIDPSVLQGMEIANSLVEDSTIYRTARGQTIGANAAYSTHALLSQSGRLPLMTPQKRIEWILSMAMERCLERLSTNGVGGSMVEKLLEDVKVPEDVTVETMLDVRLPQDKLQAANIATSLKQAGLVSDEWIQSNLLQIEQPEDMRKQVMTEQFINLQFQQFMQKTMAQQQQAQAPQPPQAVPQQQLTPEMMAQMAGGGAPVEEAIPPVPGGMA